MEDKDEDKYYSLGDAWKVFVDSKGTYDTVATGSELVGKTIANVAIFGTSVVIPRLLEKAVQSSSEVLSRDDLSEEQRENARAVNRDAKSQLERLKKDKKRS